MSKALNAMVFTLFCFLVLQGILLFNIRNSVDAAPVLLKAFELLEKSAYPRRYAFFAASHLCLVYRSSQGQMNPWMKYQVAKMKYLGQAAGDVDYSDGNQRYFMEDFLTNFTCDQCRIPIARNRI